MCEYRWVRQRTWGKWVAEIREPKKRTRLWLGSFATAKEVAMAYDEAARRLYSPEAYLNLPHLQPSYVGERFRWLPRLNLSEQHNVHVIHRRLQEIQSVVAAAAAAAAAPPVV
ncbi:dehydration-responsive element-binding protein 2E-like [Wolffia australiana]